MKTPQQPQRPRQKEVLIGGPGTILPNWLESLLSWLFAISCLSVALYHWAKQQLCLEYSDLSSSFWRIFFGNITTTNTNSNTTQHKQPQLIPLTTYCRRELEQVSAIERCHQFQQLLEKQMSVKNNQQRQQQISISDLEFIQAIRGNGILRRLATLIMIHYSSSSSSSSSSLSSSNMMTTTTTTSMTNGSGKASSSSTTNSSHTNGNDGNDGNDDNDNDSASRLHLVQRLFRLWPHLIPLPPSPSPPSNSNSNEDSNSKYSFEYEISIILPAFQEDGIQLRDKLRIAAATARRPDQIEVVLVDAGQCQQLQKVGLLLATTKTTTTMTTTNATKQQQQHKQQQHASSSSSSSSLWFANVTIVENAIGGRGPCLNLGAAHAKGRILTFLHADTRLSDGWDMAIRNAFRLDDMEQTNNNNHNHNNHNNNGYHQHENANGKGKIGNEKATTTTTTTTTTSKQQQQQRRRRRRQSKPPPRTIACAFSFAIDTSPSGLNGRPIPPGIKAIETTANWRSYLFSLPYGDQCISTPRYVFDYIGGFPDQCLMEDYEFVKLLRQRCSHSRTQRRRQQQQTTNYYSTKNDNDNDNDYDEQERLTILTSTSSSSSTQQQQCKAYCSPRRWQTHGVLYVTYTNSRIVNLYSSHGLSADDLFRLYYNSPTAPERVDEKYSPWELELQKEL